MHRASDAVIGVQLLYAHAVNELTDAQDACVLDYLPASGLRRTRRMFCSREPIDAERYHIRDLKRYSKQRIRNIYYSSSFNSLNFNSLDAAAGEVDRSSDT